MRKWNVLPSLMGFSKYVVIPVICYIPAYSFVHTVFSFQENSWVTVAKAIPAEPNTKALSDQVDALSTRINILEKMKGIQGEDLQEKYVKGLIESEAEKQAKETVKDKTDQLKGELFGQIAFPVLAAIASIFAAFAVKDILTKILEDKDREKLEEQIKANIIPQMKEILEKLVQNELDRSIDARLRWLEYEIAIIGKHFSIIYGDDNDKKKELIDKYKGEKLVAECELNIAISKLIANSDLVEKSDLLTQIWTYGTPTPQQSKINSKSVKDLIDKYINGNLDIKINKLNLMSRELKESNLLENELMTEIDNKIRGLGDKLVSYGAENRGADRASQLGEAMSMNSSVPSGK